MQLGNGLAGIWDMKYSLSDSCNEDSNTRPGNILAGILDCICQLVLDWW